MSVNRGDDDGKQYTHLCWLRGYPFHKSVLTMNFIAIFSTCQQNRQGFPPCSLPSRFRTDIPRSQHRASATACAPGTTPPIFDFPVLSYDGPKDGATAGYHCPTPPSLPDSEHFPGWRQLCNASVRESLPIIVCTRHVDGTLGTHCYPSRNVEL